MKDRQINKANNKKKAGIHNRWIQTQLKNQKLARFFNANGTTPPIASNTTLASVPIPLTSIPPANIYPSSSYHRNFDMNYQCSQSYQPYAFDTYLNQKYGPLDAYIEYEPLVLPSNNTQIAPLNVISSNAPQEPTVPHKEVLQRLENELMQPSSLENSGCNSTKALVNPASTNFSIWSADKIKTKFLPNLDKFSEKIIDGKTCFTYETFISGVLSNEIKNIIEPIYWDSIIPEKTRLVIRDDAFNALKRALNHTPIQRI